MQRLTRRDMLKLAGAGLASVALAACSGGSPATQPTQPSGQPAANGSNTAPKASGEVRYRTWGNQWSNDVEQKVIDAFHAKNPNIKVTLDNPGGNYYDKLLTEIAGGAAPDSALVDGYQIRGFINKGACIDLTDWMKRDGIKKEDYFPAMFDEFLFKGKYYYHPNMRGGELSIFYNQDLYQKAGLKNPEDNDAWNIDTFIANATALTKDAAGRTPKDSGFDSGSVQTYGLWQTRSYWWNWVYTFGGDVIDMENNKSKLSEGAGVDAFQWIADQLLKQKLSPDPSQPNQPGANQLFSAGRLAMYQNWMTDTPQYRTDIKDFKWDTAWVPKAKLPQRQSIYKGNAQVIPSLAKNKDAAWEFHKFLGGYDAMIIYGQNARFAPALKKAAEDPKFNDSGQPPKNIKVFYDERVRTLPLVVEWNEINNEAWGPELDLLWLGKKNTKDALKDADAKANEILKNRVQF